MARPEPEAGMGDTALRYVSDNEPGISRRNAGRGFSYRLPEGGLLRDPKALARIRALAIPPAWAEVWICPDPLGHLQATGRDQKGRKQYRYHPQWSEMRDAAKYAGLVDFAHGLPRLRTTVSRDLSSRGITRERVLASVVWLLDHTMIRVGNDAYARENKSFGLTTLRSRHLDIEGARLKFSFRGKSGKEWRLSLVDRRIARIMRSIQELPGQHLLQYLDADGHRHEVTSNDVNNYIQQHAGDAFSSKDFRTWGGTARALWRLAGVPVPDTERQRKIALNAVIDEVAARLGNTRSVCRKCYIHPEVIAAWQGATLPGQVAALKSGRPRQGLDAEETLTLRWLERHAGQGY